ncbi:MAG TPA: hypothetical protein VN317_04960 [Candidatus Methanoperedens sp.]|nr:hypothetical protein [Candidatus Methanoperedens sp.]
MRPAQSEKNVLVFAQLGSSQHALNARDVLRASAAFAVFCLAAGAVYLLSDLLDRAQDREHPVKRTRPIASGRLPRHSPLSPRSAAPLGPCALQEPVDGRAPVWTIPFVLSVE